MRLIRNSILLIVFGVFLLARAAFADTVSGTGSFFAMPSTASLLATQAPYTGNPDTVLAAPFWNNPSSDVGDDGHHANIGDVLGGLATSSNLIGQNLAGTTGTLAGDSATQVLGSYYAASGGLDPVNSANPTTAGGYTYDATSLAFNWVSTTTAQTIALLFADSSQDTGGLGATQFGSYTETGAGSLMLNPIGGGVGDNTSGVPLTLATNDVLGAQGSTYGFYATVCYQVVNSACTESVTYTTGAGNYMNAPAGSWLLGALGYNHFALFALNSGAMVLGFEDWPGTLTQSVEGLGDFNDVVVEISATSTPEPGTLWSLVVGSGFLSILVLARRMKKQNYLA